MKKIIGFKKNNRWWLIDKAFISLFITGLSIELSHVGAGFVDGLMVGRFFGSDALAAEGIAHPIYSFIGILSGIMFVGMQVCCAQELGRGRLKKVSEIFSITVYVGTILSFIMTFFTVMYPWKLAILFGATVFICGKMFGVYGILASCVVSDVVSLLLIYIYYMIRSGKIIPSMKDFLNLPIEFNIHPGNLISLDIHNLEEASLASEQLMMFAEGHGFDNKTANYISLALQELADNIINYGFTNKKSRKNMIDFRAVYVKDKLVVSIKDNCPKYDVTKKIAEVNAEGADLSSNMGIRIISKTASNIKYT